MSGAVSRTIGTWQPGVYSNITVDYSSRVQPYNNGSMGLSDLRLQDAGYYVVTVTETAGSSKDAGFVLKVNGEWVWDSVSFLKHTDKSENHSDQQPRVMCFILSLLPNTSNSKSDENQHSKNVPNYS